MDLDLFALVEVEKAFLGVGLLSPVIALLTARRSNTLMADSADRCRNGSQQINCLYFLIVKYFSLLPELHVVVATVDSKTL